MDNLETKRREGESFGRDGFIGPITLFTRAQCDLVMRHFRHGNPPTPLKWEKGQAASDRLIFDFATRPGLLARVRLSGFSIPHYPQRHGHPNYVSDV
jgi:hypothetical protein